MGKRFVVISSGSQWFQGQNYGQLMVSGRRGVGRNKIGGLGPTEVAGNHHQRVVMGCLAADAAGVSPLQVCLGLCGAQGKITKNKIPWNPIDELMDYIMKQVSQPESKYKSQNNYLNFCKNLRYMHI